jgi:hypothetical protein
MLKAELLNNFGYITELAKVINPKGYHSIQKVFYRQIFNIVTIQTKIIVAIIKYYNIDFIRIAIDDTLVYRSRKEKVPNGGNQYDHSNKANMKAHVYAQKWLAIIIILNINGFQISVPLWIHLVLLPVNKTNIISSLNTFNKGFYYCAYLVGAVLVKSLSSAK